MPWLTSAETAPGRGHAPHLGMKGGQVEPTGGLRGGDQVGAGGWFEILTEAKSLNLATLKSSATSCITLLSESSLEKYCLKGPCK